MHRSPLDVWLLEENGGIELKKSERPILEKHGEEHDEDDDRECPAVQATIQHVSQEIHPGGQGGDADQDEEIDGNRYYRNINQWEEWKEQTEKYFKNLLIHFVKKLIKKMNL